MSETINEPSTSEERIRDLIEAIPVGLFIVNAQNRVEACNPRCREMFRCDYEELRLRDLCSFFAATGDGPPISPDLLAEPKTQAKELVARRPDKSVFPVDVTVKAMSPSIRMVIVEDVTHRHELQRLRQEFVSMVIHDLRTPLTSIQLFLDLLNEHPEVVMPASIKTNVHAASTSLSRLLNLVKDLLDFEAVEAGGISLRLSSVDIEEVVHQAVLEVSAFASEHNITLDESGSKCDLVLQADEERLIQVVVNLLSNAIKFSPTGSTVSTAVSYSDDEVEVSIIDRGRGIPESKINLIFDRYKQVSAEDSAARKGTGLGLSICKTFIEAHGGTIGVQSTLNEGSRFWFKLPRR